MIEFILSLEPAQLITLGIVAIAILFWVTEWVPIYTTSFIILFLELVWLLPELNRNSVKWKADVFLSPFFSDTVLLFLGGFVLSAAFSKYAMDRTFAQFIIRRNNSSSQKLVYSLVFSTTFLSFWMNNTATTSLMMGISIPIVNQYPFHSGWRKVILLAIPFASNIGGIGTPVGTLPNALAIEYLRGIGRDPSFLEWMLFSVPLVILFNWLFPKILFLTFCKNESTSLPQGLELLGGMTPPPSEANISSHQKKFVMAVLLVTILGWLTTGLHGLSNGTIALIPVVVLFGARILGKSDFRNLSWDVLILMGGGITLGKAIEISGLAVSILETMPTTGDSIFMTCLFFSLITILLSSIMSNTATANLLIPLAMGLSVLDLPIVVILVAISASLAMPLPVSTPPNAIAFSFGELKTRDMVIPGMLITILGFLFLVSLGFWWIHSILAVF